MKTMVKNKSIKNQLIFIPDLRTFHFTENIYKDYQTTKEAIERREHIIYTTCLHFMSLDYTLPKYNYKIYLYLKNGIHELYEGMELVDGKEVRFAHNLEKLFYHDRFDNLLD